MSALVAKELQEQNKLLAEILAKSYLDKVYPVGSIYMNVNNVDPSSFIGGKWERLKDRFLLGAGDSYSGGSTGGSKTAVIEESNLPATRLTPAENKKGAAVSLKNSVPWGTHTVDAGAYGVTQYTLLDQLGQQPRYLATPLDIMPPYLTVYIWKRVS